LNTRKQLRHAFITANKHAANQKTKTKTWYDRRAVTRTFSIEDKVLVLFPISGKPMHAKHHGPYEIVERSGPVDYVMFTSGRRKT